MYPTPPKQLLRPLSINTEWGFSISETIKSGIIVFREHDNKIEILLLHRQKQNDWSFPKGHVEANEGLLEAGLRELSEEANVQPMIIGRLTDLKYLDGKSKPISLALFLGYSNEKESPHKMNHEGETAEWVPLTQAKDTLSYKNLQIYFSECIEPLFSQGLPFRRVPVNIIFSKTELYQNGAELLSQTLLEKGAIAHHTELDELNLDVKGLSAKCINYFLSNHQNIPNAAFWCNEYGDYVINKTYLESSHSKSQVQRTLQKQQLPVLPSRPSHPSEMKRDPSWILKNEKHDIRDFHQDHTCRWGTYVEQRADTERFKEIKLGYVAGQIITDASDFHTSPNLITALHRVQECLGLEIFSVDVFRNNAETFYIVDVNPAPAFFQNRKARLAFADYVWLIGNFYLNF